MPLEIGELLKDDFQNIAEYYWEYWVDLGMVPDTTCERTS